VTSPYILAKRLTAWRLGVDHREDLVRAYMEQNGLSERPMLKDVIDDLLIDMQGVRLLEEVLPMDTYAQTEAVKGRIVVSINQRIGEMKWVKDPAGIAYLAKWHESLHVARDVRSVNRLVRQLPMSLHTVAGQKYRLIVCRKIGTPDEAGADERELMAENAALAAAISPLDLARSQAFMELQELAARGGDITTPGWSILARSASDIGVNRTVLFRYFQQRGQMTAISQSGRQRLIVSAPLPLWTD
jgi:hypothetical protein